MKRFSIKKASVLVASLVMAVSITACGKEPSKGGEGEQTKVEAGAQLTEDEYKEKVQTLYDDIQNTSTEMLANLDQTDPEKSLESMKAMLEAVKPMYEELGALQAPDSFKDAQTKIKNGVDATVEMLDLTLEISASNMAQDDKKLQELQTKIGEVASKVGDLQTGIDEVIGS